MIDESMFSSPRLTLAGALVFEEFRETTDERIAQLYDELSDLHFLDGARSFEKFRSNGFHATDDQPHISTAFIRSMAQNPGAKLFIEFSDHSTQSDMTDVQLLGLLELRLVETIVRKYRRAERIRFTFEENKSLNAHYSTLVRFAVDRCRYKGTAEATIGGKMNPNSLAMVDYALVCFGRTLQDNSPQYQMQEWKAMRPLVSSVRCLDTGGVMMRRGVRSK